MQAQGFFHFSFSFQKSFVYLCQKLRDLKSEGVNNRDE